MKKQNRLFLIIIIVLVLFSCSDSGAGDDGPYVESHKAISLGGTLSLSGTVTKFFSSPTLTWAAGPDSAADPYDLISTTGGSDDGAVFVSDGDSDDTDDSFTFSAGTPDSGNMNTVAGWGFTSSVSGVNVYSAEVQDLNEEHIAEFLFISGEYALWYEYVYASADTVISGQDTYDGITYVFDNVSVFQGWNKVISRTADGVTYTYTGGTLSGTAWTFMKD